MNKLLRSFRPVRFGALLLALVAFAACEDGGTLPEDPQVAVVELTLVAQTGASRTVMLDASGQTPGVVTLPVGTIVVAAEYRRADGTIAPGVDGGELRLEAAASSGVSFASQGAYGGVLSVGAAGSKTVSLRLVGPGSAGLLFAGAFSFVAEA